MGKVLRDGLDALKAKYRDRRRRARAGPDAGIELVKDEPAGDRTPGARRDAAPLRGDEEARPAHRPRGPLRQRPPHRPAARRGEAATWRTPSRSSGSRSRRSRAWRLSVRCRAPFSALRARRRVRFSRALGGLARAARRPLERLRRRSDPVLEELRQLEPHGRIVDRGRKGLEVGERARAIAARLRDVGAGAKRPGRRAGAAIDRHFGGLHGAIERPGAPQRPRDAGQVLGREAALQRQRLAVEAHQRDHRDDVPRVVLDDAEERARVARPQEVQVAGAHVARRDVVDPLEAEDVALEGDEPARARAAARSLLVHAPRDVQEVEVRRLGGRRHARHDEAGARAAACRSSCR